MTTVATLQAELTKYEAARDAILEGSQSYTVNGRSVTRANLETIERKITELQSRIDFLSTSSGSRVRRPLFPSLRG